MSNDSLRYIPLAYDHTDSQTSALRLVLTIKPEWEGPGNNIEFVRFTDGITNTVCDRLSFFQRPFAKRSS
jgi:ethanolamine kinase